MKKSFPYIAPAAESQLVYTDGEIMEAAVTAFKNHDYVRSIQLLIDALDGDFRERYGNKAGTSFTIPHGSIVVNITIEPTILRISADFLRLPEKGRVAMLRKIAEMNTENLMLARFVKNGDVLKMEYSCPITDTHPHKIHAVIHNICAVGDKYDDELCACFGASRCYTPKITQYTPAQVDDVYNGLHTVGTLALNAASEYCSQRGFVYAWTILCGAIYQFSFFANPQGQLINEIDKAIESMNEERPIEELVARGVSYLNKLMDISKEDLAKDLYSVEMMVSLKSFASLQSVQEDFEDLYEDTTEAMQKRDYDQVYVRIFYSFYRLVVDNNIPLLLEYHVIMALRNSANLAIKDAAEILHRALGKLIDGEIEPEEDEAENADEDSDENESEEDLTEIQVNVAAAHQKIAEAMSGKEIVEIQKQMDEALKAGNVPEYMRLATELQLIMIKNMGS
ncbi:MAG: YbjN domain-containing protein [Muribaculaceae bacterium]|nr:YbjN domain-containing protein [Muribaculaceae bacterium]MDE5857365.1 YbjN domain-containing protein [Muribaculaceae bacterium]